MSKNIQMFFYIFFYKFYDCFNNRQLLEPFHLDNSQIDFGHMCDRDNMLGYFWC